MQEGDLGWSQPRAGFLRLGQSSRLLHLSLLGPGVRVMGISATALGPAQLEAPLSGAWAVVFITLVAPPFYHSPFATEALRGENGWPLPVREALEA